MKKLLMLAGFFLFVLTPHALAQGFVPLAPIAGLTDPATVNSSTSLATFFNNLYKYLIGLAAVIAIIQIIWAGLEISTQDSVSKQSQGRERITQAILGLVLVLSPVLVFSIINPSILNLSLNLPSLNTTTASTTPGGGSVEPPTTGCTITGTSGILQIATCASVAAAAVWVESCNGSRATTQNTNPTNGIVTTLVTCSGNQNYVFIQPSFSLTDLNIANRIRPLVRTTANQNNAADAMTFRDICRGANLGLQTCVSDDPDLSSDVPCNLSGPNAATSWKCYNEKLICKDAATLNIYCSSNPSWTPYE